MAIETDAIRETLASMYVAARDEADELRRDRDELRRELIRERAERRAEADRGAQQAPVDSAVSRAEDQRRAAVARDAILAAVDELGGPTPKELTEHFFPPGPWQFTIFDLRDALADALYSGALVMDESRSLRAGHRAACCGLPALAALTGLPGVGRATVGAMEPLLGVMRQIEVPERCPTCGTEVESGDWPKMRLRPCGHSLDV